MYSPAAGRARIRRPGRADRNPSPRAARIRPERRMPTQPACVEFYETPRRVEARLAVSASKAQEPKARVSRPFAALSLEPPLVLFCPTKGSRSWAAIEANGRF
ncbi:flavin reductase family protein, partial [Nocardia rhamnosiphila]